VFKKITSLFKKVTLSKVLLYVSLVAICIFLVDHHYLTVPTIHSFSLLGISIILLFVAFLIDSFGWKLIVSSAGLPVSYGLALRSSGLYVFTKYIPGKFWMIFGKASYLSERLPATTKYLSTLSVFAQVISLGSGVLTGLVAPLLLDQGDWLLLPVAVALLVTIVLAWTGVIKKMMEFFFKKLKIDFEIPSIPRNAYILLFTNYLLFWLCLCAGFYFMAQSFSEQPIAIASGFSFAFSCTIGIVALFAPGGIGVREGVLTGYLTLTGLPLELATQIAIGSRLWFMSGEFFIFLLALIAGRLNLK